MSYARVQAIPIWRKQLIKQSPCVGACVGMITQTELLLSGAGERFGHALVGMVPEGRQWTLVLSSRAGACNRVAG